MLTGFGSSSSTGLWMLLFPPASSTSASRTRTSFGLRWTSRRHRRGRWSISKTPRCSSGSRKVWGFGAFFTRITGPRAQNWLRSDCRNDEGIIHGTSQPTHPDDQWGLVEHQVCTVRGGGLAATGFWGGGWGGWGGGRAPDGGRVRC